MRTEPKTRALRVGKLSTLAMLVAAVACTTEPAGSPEKVGTAATAIQGGVLDKGHGFAVGVCGTDTSPGTCAVVCSGVLIAPNLVATARHCVDHVSSTTVDCTSDTFGALLAPASQFWITTNYDLLQASLGWHQVNQIVVPQPTAFCGNDLALLVLKDNVPASEASPATPEVQYPMTDPSIVSGTETAIGYGDTSPGGSTYGTRHTKQDIPILCIPGDAESPCAPVAQSGIAQNEFAAGDGPCDGDSGSSSFEQNSFNQGSPLALGILSRGGVTGAACTGSVYTRFDSWRDLIVQTATSAAAMGAYPLPSWTVAIPDAGSDAAVVDADAACAESDACTSTAQGPHASAGCSAAGRSGELRWRGLFMLALTVGTLLGARRRGRRQAAR
jgi:hypothetical protein